MAEISEKHVKIICKDNLQKQPAGNRGEIGQKRFALAFQFQKVRPKGTRAIASDQVANKKQEIQIEARISCNQQSVMGGDGLV